MKPASGYVTSDGRFFEHLAEAEYHEARQELYDALNEIETGEGRFVDPDKFIEILAQVYPNVERLINGYKADPKRAEDYEAAVADERERLRQALLDSDGNPAQGNGEAPSQSRPYRASRENPPGVQQLSVGGYESVSNVGRGQRPEDVQDGG